jgi:glycosyltransferase involved in cell wall biosynthesis
VIVSDDPSALAWLPASSTSRFVKFSERAYAQALLDADVIISPKHLSNGYEMAHTEYKISLGMAVGLPAVASPQPSYLEAIDAAGGGVIARTPQEWRDAFARLRDPEARAVIGAAAQRTVLERYTTALVARQYGDLLRQLVELAPVRPYAAVSA